MTGNNHGQPRDVTFLVADLQVGLKFARAAIRTSDPWVVALNRTNAERIYDAVCRLLDRLNIAAAGRAFLAPRIEQLRLAIQTAYLWQPRGHAANQSSHWRDRPCCERNPFSAAK